MKSKSGLEDPLFKGKCLFRFIGPLHFFYCKLPNPFYFQLHIPAAAGSAGGFLFHLLLPVAANFACTPPILPIVAWRAIAGGSIVALAEPYYIVGENNVPNL